MFWKRFLRHRIGMIGLGIILFNMLVALMAPWLATHSPLQIDIINRALPPSANFLFGTDDFGRDIFSRVVYGTRISLYICALSVLFASILGVIIGATAGYYEGWIDNVIMRCMDAVMSFPAILLAIGIMAVRGGNINNVVIALGFVYTPRFARLVRGSVLSLKKKEFVEAAVAGGNGDLVIIFRHILPNCMAPMIVLGTLRIGTAIITAAGLSFLGFGVPPPHATWGNILSNGKNFIFDAPWLTFIPGFAILIVVLSFNLFGEGLRDVLNPKLRERN